MKRAIAALFVMACAISFCGGLIVYDRYLYKEPPTVPIVEDRLEPMPYTLPLQYATAVIYYCDETGVPVWMACRMFSAESSLSGKPTDGNWNAQAVSWAGARGIAQIMPANLTDPLFLSFNDGNPIDPMDPETAIRVGIRYLAHLRSVTGRWDYGVGGYNAGPQVQPHLWKLETVNYVRMVLGGQR